MKNRVFNEGKSSTAVSMPFLIRLMGRNRKVKEKWQGVLPCQIKYIE